jgi:putative flippase GtrA
MPTSRTRQSPGHPRKKTAKKNWRQFFRYLLVGGSSFLLEYGAFYILLTIYQVNYLIANSIVYSILAVIGFVLNRLWTFRSKKQVTRQIVLYLGLLIFNFLASNVMLYILSGQLQISPLWAKIAVMVIVVLWNFVIYKKVIYR